MKLRALTIYFLFGGGLFAGLSYAHGPECQPVIDVQTRMPRVFVISKFTHYEPGRNDNVQGHCGQSAYGYDACAHTLEKFLAGQSNVGYGAVSQKSGSAALIGGVYRLMPLEFNGVKGPAGCVVVAVGDRYNTESNGLDKMDIATETNTKFARHVNSSSGTIVLTSAFERLRAKNGPRRTQRSPEAQAAAQAPPKQAMSAAMKKVAGKLNR